MDSKKKRQQRQRRKMAIRKHLSGTSERPRVFINRSNKYITVSAADDVNSLVLGSIKSDSKMEAASKLGKEFAELLKSKKIETVVFDRSGYKYHGKVKEIAEALRSNGINL